MRHNDSTQQEHIRLGTYLSGHVRRRELVPQHTVILVVVKASKVLGLSAVDGGRSGVGVFGERGRRNNGDCSEAVHHG